MPATAETRPETRPLSPPTPAFPWPTVPLDIARLQNYLRDCDGLGYRLGAKARAVAAPRPDYPAIDCSGWVRCAVAVATRGRTILPDGSVVQREWCGQVGLKPSTPMALLLRDGYTRIAFLVPTRAHPVGHVYLCRNGRTLESWGGHGPGSRSVLAHISRGLLPLPLQRVTTSVYVLGPKDWGPKDWGNTP